MAPHVLIGMLWLAMVVALPAPAHAQAVDPGLRSDIERLLDITGTSTLGAQAATAAVDQMLRDLARSLPNVPDRATAAVREVLGDELSKAFVAPEMRARQVAIYAERFSRDEVRALLAFYETAVGRKASAVVPVLLQAGMAAGQEWIAANVERLGALIEARFKAEGVIR